MKCGNCGGATATVAAATPQGTVGFLRLDLTCTGCGETTSFRPEAKIVQEAADTNAGAFCVGWGED